MIAITATLVAKEGQEAAFEAVAGEARRQVRAGSGLRSAVCAVAEQTRRGPTCSSNAMPTRPRWRLIAEPDHFRSLGRQPRRAHGWSAHGGSNARSR
jgi:hypothetical protein